MSYWIYYPKLGSACYIKRSIKPFIALNTLKTIYYSYFNAIIRYGLPSSGNSSHAIKLFSKHKRIVRIMMSCKNRISCRNLFRRLEILPFVFQYILLLMLFVVKNKNLFIFNSETHIKITTTFNNLFQTITNFTIYQSGVHYMGIKIFNNHPSHIKDISNNGWKFEICWKQFLHIHSF